MSSEMIRILPKRDDAPAVAPGLLVHLGNDERWILVPVDAVRVDTDEARVVLEHLPSGGLNRAPRQRGLVPTTEEQRVIHAYFELQSAGIGPR